LRLLART